MNVRRSLLTLGVILLAACGSDSDESARPADSLAAPADSTLPAAAPVPPAGTVDTAGVGVSPPTAGGQLVDTGAVPGAVDTTAGTPTAP